MRPLVSIVTVNRNMKEGLAATLKSVLEQDYPALEVLVIDGGSTDGSRDVIAAHAARLAYWVSEPDESLYDAMNKGVAAAKGEWVLFMNAGDLFASAHALSDLFPDDHGDADLVYGDHLRRYPGSGIERLVRAEEVGVLPRRMPCSHQALAVRRGLLSAHPFDLSLLVADYAFLIAAHRAGKRFKRMDCVVARIEMGGRSDTARLRSLRERVGILRRHGLLNLPLQLHYHRLVLRALLSLAVRKLLPRSLTNWILRHKPVQGG